MCCGTKSVFPSLTNYYESKLSNEPHHSTKWIHVADANCGKTLKISDSWSTSLIGWECRVRFLAQSTTRSDAKPHYSFNQSGYRSDTWPCFVSKAEVAENSEEPENEEENEKNSKSSSSTKFRLVGILVHSGQASGGHYYSYVLQRYISSPLFVILQHFTRRLPLIPARTLT